MVKTIAIRNPAIIKRVTDAQANGVGRSITETAENMIVECCDKRQSSKPTHNKSRRRPSATAS